MLFRHLLTLGYSSGKRGKCISKRSFKTLDSSLVPVLLIDCSYLAYLLESRHATKRSNVYNIIDDRLLGLMSSPVYKLSLKDKAKIYNTREIILTLLSNTIATVCPEHIILVYGSSENLLKSTSSEKIVKAILDPLHLPSITLSESRFADFAFTFLQQNSTDLTDKLVVYVTNSISTWACCSHTLQHGFIAYTKNLRPLFYTSKTGLDIVSRFISTSKIINKLGLDDIKYVNLQYIYLILLYIKFLHHKQKDSTYFFDAKYFKQEKGVEYSDFLRSNGKGLDMIADAHKTLSYIFLTKSDLMDQFLFFTTHNFLLNMKRLLKITEFDKDLMSYFSNYYMETDKLREISTKTDIFFATLYRDRTKQGISKVKLFPGQYTPVLTALARKKSGEKITKKSVTVLSETPDMNVGDEAIAKILRTLLW